MLKQTHIPKHTSRRRHWLSVVIPVVLFSFYILHSPFFIALPAHAQVRLLPTPTGDCPKYPEITKKPADPKGKTLEERQGLVAVAYVPMQCDVQIKEIKKKEGLCYRSKGAIATDIPCNYTLDDIVRAFTNGARLIFAVIGSLALLMFVIGGSFIMNSRGNPEDVNKGKSILVNSIIAIIITLGASMFIAAVGKLLGVGENIIQPTSEIILPSAECKKGVASDGDACGPKKLQAQKVYRCDCDEYEGDTTCQNDGVCIPDCQYRYGAEGYACLDKNIETGYIGPNSCQTEANLCEGGLQCCKLLSK